jgi:hypothetical protein
MRAAEIATASSPGNQAAPRGNVVSLARSR